MDIWAVEAEAIITDGAAVAGTITAGAIITAVITGSLRSINIARSE